MNATATAKAADLAHQEQRNHAAKAEAGGSTIKLTAGQIEILSGLDKLNC